MALLFMEIFLFSCLYVQLSIKRCAFFYWSSALQAEWNVVHMNVWGNYLFAVYVLVGYLHPDRFVQQESTQSRITADQ